MMIEEHNEKRVQMAYLDNIPVLLVLSGGHHLIYSVHQLLPVLVLFSSGFSERLPYAIRPARRRHTGLTNSLSFARVVIFSR